MAKDKITHQDFVRIFEDPRFKRELRKSGNVCYDTGNEAAFKTYLYLDDDHIAVHPHYVGRSAGLAFGDDDVPDSASADYPEMVGTHFHPGYRSGADIQPSDGDLYAVWIMRQTWAKKEGLYVLPLSMIGIIDDKKVIDLLVIQDKEYTNPLNDSFHNRDLGSLFSLGTPRTEDVGNALRQSGYYNVVTGKMSRGKYSEGFFEELKTFEHDVSRV